MKITLELIKAGKSTNGGWSRPQLNLLGVDWPPKSGWQASVIGSDISEFDAKMFIHLGNLKNDPHSNFGHRGGIAVMDNLTVTN